MQIDSLDFKRLLPTWMQEDTVDLAFSDSVNELTKSLANHAKVLTRWDKLDQLTDAELDELANELNIDWYYSSADKDTKVNLIKNSDIVHSKLGTDYAVNQTIEDYFGSGHVVPWYEYDGQPYHFRIETDQIQRVADNYLLFLDILQKVKRASTVLDATVLTLQAETPVYMGVCYHELTVETVNFQNIEEE